jgi:type IV secretion system protein VirB9
MKRLAAIGVMLWLLGAPAASLAAITPQPGPGDPRIRVVRYDPDEVVALRATLGYQITIEFGDGEHLENVSIGNSLGWQVTPNRKTDLLFVKPMERAANTNMTVITNLRRYAFDLSARRARRGGDRSVIFGLRFDYPAPVVLAAVATPAPKLVPPQDVNHAYSFEGSRNNLPTRVFDDGHATYFTFAENVDFPAIFAIEADRKEALVNVASRDGYVIVDQIARGFVLRRGGEVTTLVNDGFQAPQPGPLSPKPRSRSRGLFQ